MPAKSILFALICLSPLCLSAEEIKPAPTGRYAAHPPSRSMAGAAPRRLPGAPANALKSEREPVDDSSQVEAASYATREPAPLTNRADVSRPLPPRANKDAKQGRPAEKPRAVGAASSILSGMASLLVVLGLFFGVAWALRRGMPAGPAALPSEAVEVLGRTTLAGRQHAHLIRCGNKVLLVYLAQGIAETLTEITDPLEVDRLTGLCRQSHPQSATKSFRQVLQQFGREKAAPGFLERAAHSVTRDKTIPRPLGVDAALEDSDV
jgi:flagellar protein FliO/FliZ